MSTAHHAYYYIQELLAIHSSFRVDRLTLALLESVIDLNPHQIEASLFALRSPLSKGVILADEVGLGKTIEAGLLLCQFWAEHKRKLLVICPASLRKQWAIGLEEKFHIPSYIVDKQMYMQKKKEGYSSLQYGGAINCDGM